MAELFHEIFPESEFELEFAEAGSDGSSQSGSELDRPVWSVVSFGGIEAGGLTYHQADRLRDVLADNGLHGLAIITDEAAARLSD
ncbi:MAG TPA: hypothetical protein VL501_00015 [Pyrinomonadaceae bacterium]|nr:hypothetical protein [Pyrinomonadaceae bacterium]